MVKARRADKAATVDELREKIARCTIAIAADYRGLTVADMGQLRRRLREAGVEVRVIKNTLFRLAAQQAGRSEVATLAEGPTAIAFGYSDEVAPAKAVAEYLRTAGTPISLRRAYVSGQILGPKAITDLAELPPREVLLGRLAGSLQFPLAQFVALVRSPLQELMGLLGAEFQRLSGLIEARARQMEGGEGETEVAVPA